LANSLTHGVGLLAAIVGCVLMLVYAAGEGAIHVVASSVYGGTLIALYLTSTLYHAIPWRKPKRWLRVADHTAIFFFIAGTYTPVSLLVLPPVWGWPILGLVWAVCAVGVGIKLSNFDSSHSVGLWLYLAMGWMAVVAIYPLVQTMSWGGLALLGTGGLGYTVGVLFYVSERRFFHTIWHLFVILGSACHWAAMYVYVL
jgi:hemolysin III